MKKFLLQRFRAAFGGRLRYLSEPVTKDAIRHFYNNGYYNNGYGQPCYGNSPAGNVVGGAAVGAARGAIAGAVFPGLKPGTGAIAGAMLGGVLGATGPRPAILPRYVAAIALRRPVRPAALQLRHPLLRSPEWAAIRSPD